MSEARQESEGARASLAERPRKERECERDIPEFSTPDETSMKKPFEGGYHGKKNSVCAWN